MRNNIVIILSLALFLASCNSIKPGATKGGKNYYETFFVGEQGTQYYIKPLTFESASNGTLKLDVTFRYRNKVQDSAIINFGINDVVPYKTIDSAFIESGDTKVKLQNVSMLFVEKKKDILSRYTSKCSLADAQRLYKNSDWVVKVYTGTAIPYKLNSKGTKVTSKINENIFALF